MTQINKLSATDTVTAGDLVPVWSQGNGDTRKAALSVLQAYMQANLTFSAGKPATQYASPLTGTTVSVTGTGDTWLVLTPAGTIATLTVALPSAPVNKQEVAVSSSQTVTALTLSGGTVIGAPTTVGAAAPFRLRYEGVAGAWYKVA
jgi:hypothetical protein